MNWSWIFRFLAIATSWVRNLSILSLLSNWRSNPFLMFIKICWYRMLPKPRLINWVILIKSKVALAIKLNSTSSNFSKWHNRSINSYLPFEGIAVGERLENWNCTFWNFKISLTYPKRITSKLFYLLPAPRSRCLILLLHERHTLLSESSILDSF